MARARLTEIKQDLINDEGAVLWSFVKGEQLEFPISLNFVEDATLKPSNNYTYEAVVIEADNVSGQDTKPTTVKAGGINTTLFIRIPTYEGTWSNGTLYIKEEVVAYSGKYYRLLASSNTGKETISPDQNNQWIETQLNIVYLQFPSTLGSTWAVQPVVNSPVYGFFELRVTEPTDPVFTRTFKPVRGMVEILFSPTAAVTDVVSQTQP